MSILFDPEKSFQHVDSDCFIPLLFYTCRARFNFNFYYTPI